MVCYVKWNSDMSPFKDPGLGFLPHLYYFKINLIWLQLRNMVWFFVL